MFPTEPIRRYIGLARSKKIDEAAKAYAEEHTQIRLKMSPNSGHYFQAIMLAGVRLQRSNVDSFIEIVRDACREAGRPVDHEVRTFMRGEIHNMLESGKNHVIQSVTREIGQTGMKLPDNLLPALTAQASTRISAIETEIAREFKLEELKEGIKQNVQTPKPVETKPPSLVPTRGPAPTVVANGEPIKQETHDDQTSEWDVFISHATEDKAYVEPLVRALKAAGIKFWFDKSSIEWGDDLRTAIDRGLSNCKYGIVVFSEAFLSKKKWTEYELNSLFAREKAGKKLILPIWHNVTREELLRYSPGFADRFAKLSTTDTYDDIVQALLVMLGRMDSPNLHQKITPTSPLPRHEETSKQSRVPYDTSGDLNPREIELLWNATKDPSGDILHNLTMEGESIRINGRQFLENADARTGAEWVAAFHSLEERGFIEPLSYGSHFFRVTGEGYLAADQLEGFARSDAASIVLRARYLNAPHDEITLACKGIIAIPPRYFEEQTGADGLVQRSLKEPRTLLAEGIGSQPTLSWNPTEVEFVDGTSGQSQIFLVGGMRFVRPNTLKFPIVENH